MSINDYEFMYPGLGQCRMEYLPLCKSYVTPSGRLCGGTLGLILAEWGLGGSWSAYAVGKRSGGEDWITKRWFFHWIQNATTRHGVTKGLGIKKKGKRISSDPSGIFFSFVLGVGGHQQLLLDPAQDISVQDTDVFVMEKDWRP